MKRIQIPSLNFATSSASRWKLIKGLSSNNKNTCHSFRSFPSRCDWNIFNSDCAANSLNLFFFFIFNFWIETKRLHREISNCKTARATQSSSSWERERERESYLVTLLLLYWWGQLFWPPSPSTFTKVLASNLAKVLIPLVLFFLHFLSRVNTTL